ncbi:S8 family serine peptidase [Actinomadura yumaensis]|nr:S8 family serine peptidase [Actinomadura sp. J1-007]
MGILGCALVLLTHGTTAMAVPSPRPEEWWFDAWEIEDKVWPLTRGTGVIVALVDTGVQADLPDLRGVVMKGKLREGEDGRRDLDRVKNGHGTAMAALIAGQGRETGMMGVAPEARILPLLQNDNLALSIKYAVDHGASVINFSLGGDSVRCPDDLQEAIRYAADHNAVVVASAGNEGASKENLNYPANCLGVVTVGGVDANLKMWRKSVPANTLALAAPSVAVGSINKHGLFGWNNNGTSQAAALTSGVVALLRARFPQMSARELVQRMLATAKDVDPPGRDKLSGFGALIPYLALTANVPRDSPNPVYAGLSVNPPSGKSGSAQSEADPAPRSASNTGKKSSAPWFFGVGVLIAAGLVAVTVVLILRRRAKRVYRV